MKNVKRGPKNRTILLATPIYSGESFYDFLLHYSPQFAHDMNEDEKQYLKTICDHLEASNKPLNIFGPQSVTKCNQEEAA